MSGSPVQSMKCFMCRERTEIEVRTPPWPFSGRYRQQNAQIENIPETRETLYVICEDIFDAKNACGHLLGFNVYNRYFVDLYCNANRAFQKVVTKKKEEWLKLLMEEYGLITDPPL